MRYWLCIVLLFLACRSGYSQYHSLSFKRLSTSEGLSHSWVRVIYQDETGFMWFGTADGLNRYDGDQFRVYRPKVGGNSMGDINISGILKKSDNELWVCTDLGVYTYNYQDDELHPFAPLRSLTALCVSKDKEQNFWFGTNKGLYKLNPKDNKLVSFTYDPNNEQSLSNSYVNAICEDADSNVWIGTKRGLNLYIKKQNLFKRFKPKEITDGVSTNDILSICIDSKNRAWVAYAQDGLFVFSRDNAGNYSYEKVFGGKIIKLLIDNRNTLWVGRGSGEGLERMPLDKFVSSKQFQSDRFFNNPLNIKSLSDNSIYSLYQDNRNDLWVGTFGGGINYFSERAKKFNVLSANFNLKPTIRNNLVNGIQEDETYVYLGTEAGLDILRKKDNAISHYDTDPDDPTSLTSNAIYALYLDKHHNLWVGTWAGGLNLFVPKSKSFKHFIADGKPGSISSSNVFSIFEDSRNNLWVGTIGGGLNRYDYKTSTFTQYKHDPNNPLSINDDMVNCIYETSNGKLYVSTYNSLDQFDYKTGTFSHIKHDCNDVSSHFGNIISMVEDSRKNLWIATNLGLEYYNEKNKTFTSYTTRHGLPDNTIQGILEDSHGNLWISTNHGLSKFNNGVNLPAVPTFHNYTVHDGLSGNEFKKRSAFKNKDGIMYFGSSQGLTYFHPDSIKLNPYPPNVLITGFSILHSIPDMNDKFKEIPYSINFTKKLEISYRNTDFIIRYAALNYLNPQNNLFRYKLDGYDKDWIDAGNLQSATYTNLQPGTYTFMVKASNNDGVWCQTPQTLSIFIRPPWWKTQIFRIFLVLLISILIYAIFQIRIRVLEHQKKLLERVVKSRTIELSNANALLEERQEEITIQNEELASHRNNLAQLVEERTSELEIAKIKAEASDHLKSAFLANMSHEIRTPMNAILGFASFLNNRNLTEQERKSFVDIINNNCNSLLVLIDDILDMSLIESNQLAITKEEFDPTNILKELESFYLLKSNHKVEIKFINSDALTLNNDPVRFRQIVSNLLDNAMKYTDAGHIWFGYDVNDGWAHFYVSDTGIGIGAEEKEKIFNHFYKVEHEKVRLYRGTGIGLAICKKMVELMGGSIWVESVVNMGSTFHFTLPVQPQPMRYRLKEENESIVYNFKGQIIVIAEDEADNYKLLSSILKPYEPEIFWVKNGKEAVEFMQDIASTENVIVLMDIKMPIMDGYEANREIKKHHPNVPVIAVTAYAQASDRQYIEQEKFVGYVAKPINKKTLLDMISKHLLK